MIHQEATSGIIIAGSILGARALAPVDLAIANWRGFVAARQGWHRLSHALRTCRRRQRRWRCTAGKDARGQNAAVAPPGEQKLVVPGRELLARAPARRWA